MKKKEEMWIRTWKKKRFALQKRWKIIVKRMFEKGGSIEQKKDVNIIVKCIELV